MLATLSLEQTVEVLGKHEGGTGPIEWHRSAEGSRTREWTEQGASAEGRESKHLVDRSSRTHSSLGARRDPGMDGADVWLKSGGCSDHP